MYLISACLLGENCKYSGGNNANEKVIEFAKTHSYMKVCPEVAGKLPTPRPPAEIQTRELAESGFLRIMNTEGMDVTAEFINGAKETLMQAQAEARGRGEAIEGAILKAKSPSCGKDKIYDGSFSGTLTEGNGVFVIELKKLNIKVISEKELYNGIDPAAQGF